MGDALWPEVTRALEEKRHELTLSNADVADRLKACGLDVRIFQIKTLNFLEMSNITLEQLPETIGHLENMINLALQRNQLIEIPQSIGNLLNLKFLDISFNKLIGLPDSLGSLKALHTLNLNCNELQCLPNLEGLSSLVILHIDHNKLSALPDGIFGLVHLMEIHASHNQITEISEDLNQIEALKIIDLSNNKIKQLPEQIAYCQKLKELNLKENPLSDNRLRKMTSQCSTKAIMDYVASHSGDQTKGKKGKKKKQGKDLHKENEFGVDTRQIYVTRMSKEEKHVIFKDVMKEIRPYIVCTVIKGLDLSDLQMYKKFINLQSKLHDTVCDSRMKATIATHDYKQIYFPLVYDAKHPDDISIIPLGQNSEMSGADYIKKLIAQKEQEDKKKKRQQSSGVYRFLDLIQQKDLYPCMLSENKVVSLPPVTNSDVTKMNPSICDVFIEVTSTVSLPTCKEIMDYLILQLFQLGFSSSPYADSSLETEGKTLKGLVLQQIKVTHEDGQTRVVYPSKIDLKFENIHTSFLE